MLADECYIENTEQIYLNGVNLFCLVTFSLTIKSLNQQTQGSITSSKQLNRQTETQVLLSLVLWFIVFKSCPLSSIDSKQ